MCTKNTTTTVILKLLLPTHWITWFLTLQTRILKAHYDDAAVAPTRETDLLTLKSGHNDLSKRLVEFIDMKYQYDIDIVSLIHLLNHTIHFYTDLFQEVDIILFVVITYTSYTNFLGLQEVPQLPLCQRASACVLLARGPQFPTLEKGGGDNIG